MSEGAPGMAGRRRGLRRRHRGQAMVEMGLVVMLLLTLTFGIADLGIFMFKYVQAANCVREAARRAVVRDPNAGSPPLCVSSDLQPTISPAGYATLKAGQPVTATINQTHTWIVIGYLVPGMGDTVPLKAATTMRMEGQFSPGT